MDKRVSNSSNLSLSFAKWGVICGQSSDGENVNSRPGGTGGTLETRLHNFLGLSAISKNIR